VTAFDQTLRKSIGDNIARLIERPADGHAELKDSAVAIVVSPGTDGAASFILTRRAARMGRHAGQWALPGGRVDQGETFEAAARREVHEEIGLALAADAHLGALEGYETRSGYFIVPHVYWCEDLTSLSPNPAEVAGVHHIALTALHSPGSPEFLAGDTPGRPILRLHLGRDHVHAPTAALLYQFREVALSGRYISVAHYDQPDFARR
jgi:8-oxo-dGTP pyrophosphatase MutT (NUDIX family)